MEFPSNLKYTEEHEWVLLEADSSARVGITDFAQSELGEIVYVEVNAVGEALKAGDVFGTVEAVKTTSELFLPISGTILEVNTVLEGEPELVNTDPYGAGWIIKIKISNPADLDNLMSDAAYKAMVG